MIDQPPSDPPAPRLAALKEIADEMAHELFIVGNHPALGVDHVMVERWRHQLAILSADPPVPPLVDYMQADTREQRSAALLRTYAERIRNGTAATWEIPNTVASTLEDIANLLASAPPAPPATAQTLSDERIARCHELLQSSFWAVTSPEEHPDLCDAAVALLMNCDNPVCKATTAALSQAGSPATDQWQPIETAPKDGRGVLLWWVAPHGKPGVVLAHWMCRAHAHLSRRLGCPDDPECQMSWDSYAGDMTHWMPLPSHPGAPAGPRPASGEERT